MLAEAGASDTFPFCRCGDGFVRRIYRADISALLSNPVSVRVNTSDGQVILYYVPYVVARVWNVIIPEGKIPVIVKPLDLKSIGVNCYQIQFVNWVDGWRPFWVMPKENHAQPIFKTNPRATYED